MKLLLSLLGAFASVAIAQTPPAAAPVSATGAWARPTVQGQRGTGAYMSLTATEPLTLVGASTPSAGVAEVHEMKMDGDIMRMRALPSLELPVGKTVELKPGGLHVMLMDLKGPLAANSTVPLTLTFRNARGQQSRLELQVPVSATAPAGAKAAAKDPHAGHGAHKH
jgi:copper(I)-binding protein